MKRPGWVLPGGRLKVQHHKVAQEQKESPLRSNEDNNRHLLLRDLNFVAKSPNARREPPPLACEASALTTELTAPNHSYFSPKNQLCKQGTLASSYFCTDIGSLLHGYQICAATEGKSSNSIDIVAHSVYFFQDFLVANGIGADISGIDHHRIRAFSLLVFSGISHATR
jgi:hypothetical protein